MADIELIIKIDEDIYNHMKERYMYSYATACTTELNKVGFAVRNGIPLPKGHGRLIDADCLREDFKASKKISFAERMDISCIVDHAETIIEADKESE